MLTRNDASPADLMRAWRGKRGLSKDGWLDCVNGSFFAGSDETQKAAAGAALKRYRNRKHGIFNQVICDKVQKRLKQACKGSTPAALRAASP